MGSQLLDASARRSLRELSDVISALGAKFVVDPVCIVGNDSTSLEGASRLTSNFITRALTEVLGPELGNRLETRSEVRGLDRNETPFIEFSYALPHVGEMVGQLTEGGFLRADRLRDGTIVIELEYGGHSYFWDEQASSRAELAVARPSGDTFIKVADDGVFLVTSYCAEKSLGGDPVIVATGMDQEPVSTLLEAAVVVQMLGGMSRARFIQPPEAAEKIAQLLQDNNCLREYLEAVGHWMTRIVASESGARS